VQQRSGKLSNVDRKTELDEDTYLHEAVTVHADYGNKENTDLWGSSLSEGVRKHDDIDRS